MAGIFIRFFAHPFFPIAAPVKAAADFRAFDALVVRPYQAGLLVALAAVSTPPRISMVNGADFASGEPIGICVDIFFSPENGCG